MTTSESLFDKVGDIQLPVLYKKNNEGKIESWQIKRSTNWKTKKCIITMTYGEIDGKKITKEFVVDKGKNLGKATATNFHTQGYSESKSKWEKKLKSGYVQSLDDAKAGKVDKIIKGGINPMLAESFKDFREQVSYPVLVQPKLNGHRCIVMKTNGVVTMWTRKRQQIFSMPHIVEAMELILKSYSVDLFIDGELYTHGMPLNQIASIVRKQEPTEDSPKVQFHIYDCNFIGKEAPYSKRYEFLLGLDDTHPSISYVTTLKCHKLEEVVGWHTMFEKRGFEGVMVRDPSSVYQHRRTRSLLKLKSFLDDEFPIIGVREGRDDTVVFICTHEGNEFEVTMSGSKKGNQKYLNNKKLWLNKMLCVKYQEMSVTKKPVPLCPVGLYIREPDL